VSTRLSPTLLAAIAMVACGAGSNPGAPSSASPGAGDTSSPSSPRAVVTIAVSPTPVVSTGTGDSRASREAHWQVVLRETGGVGATVNFIDATLRDATTGVLADPHGVLTQSSTDVLAAAGSSHLAAGGSLTVPQGLTFTLQGGPAAPGRLAVTAQLTDDAGNVVGASATATIE
jgi:hypothetical protein